MSLSKYAHFRALSLLTAAHLHPGEKLNILYDVFPFDTILAGGGSSSHHGRLSHLACRRVYLFIFYECVYFKLTLRHTTLFYASGSAGYGSERDSIRTQGLKQLNEIHPSFILHSASVLLLFVCFPMCPLENRHACWWPSLKSD